jgi:DNA-binding response OmpR family regulator
MTANGDGSKLVLVADDDRDIRILVAYRLVSNGFEVVMAKDGEEALHLAAERAPDLVQEADVARGFEPGAADYLRKPFSPQEVGMRVQAIVGRT